MSFSKHTFGSLFAGVGGFDMGFEQAGWDCKFQVEWDKHCQSVLNRHWPDVPKWGDVSETSGHELPAVDCIIFGSPCQDLSVAGKRAGLEGERSGLFHEAMRIIKEMRDATNGTFPRWIVWENVAGAFSSNKGADFGTVLDEMAAAGAVAIEWALLDAQHFGVPQRRRRVFVVACFDPATADRCPDPLLPVSESLPGDPAKGRKKGKAVAGEAGESITDGYRMRGFGDYAEDGLASAIKARDHKDVTDLIVGSLAARDYKGVGSQYVDEGKVIVEPMLLDGRRVDDIRIYEPPVQTLQARMGTGGNNVPVVGVDNAVAYSVREDAKANTFSATELDHANALSAVWPSPQSHHAQMFIAEPAMAVRRLTPVECERLMGWPDDHTRWTADGKEQSDTHRYKQCGNGVATPVARWIADHMRRVDEIQ